MKSPSSKVQKHILNRIIEENFPNLKKEIHINITPYRMPLDGTGKKKKSRPESTQSTSGCRVYMKMPLRATLCFPTLIVMDTGKYFSPTEERAGLSEMIKWTAL